jgi:hypothetical protein
MYRFSMVFAAIVFACFVHAESVDVKDVDSSEDTTIEIHKGKKKKDAEIVAPVVVAAPSPAPSVSGAWETHEDTSDVIGATGALASEAKKNWSDACKAEEKKFRDERKENGDKVIKWECGAPPVCSGDAGNKSCVSKAKFKFKSKAD